MLYPPFSYRDAGIYCSALLLLNAAGTFLIFTPYTPAVVIVPEMYGNRKVTKESTIWYCTVPYPTKSVLLFTNKLHTNVPFENAVSALPPLSVRLVPLIVPPDTFVAVVAVVALTAPPVQESDLVAVVAVAALPVQEPEDPLTLPVTLPVNGPTKLFAVATPLIRAFPVT